MKTNETELDRVIEQIRNTRRLLATSFAVKRGTGRLLTELDRLIDRKHELESRQLHHSEVA